MEPHENDNQQEPAASGRMTAGSLLVGAVLAILVIVAAIAVFRVDTWGENDDKLSDRFKYDIDEYTTVDPLLVGYKETAKLTIDMGSVHAIAVGPEDHVYVAGDQAVRVFDGKGDELRAVDIGKKPSCLAVAGPDHTTPGYLYVGVADRVEVYDSKGEPAGVWDQDLDEKSILTSIAVADADVFVADAGNRVVLRYDSGGELVGRIGDPDPKRNLRSFVIPSPYFDVAVTASDVVCIVNPGARQIEAYTFDGAWLGEWGKASADIDGFFGCCNPANFAVLADGKFVTVEKGLPRIKVYSREGDFECVVAEPRVLAPGEIVVDEIRDDHRVKVFDVATDSSGRILVLDPTNRTVRVFEPT